ncbi:helix-turn-helix domain-containing protein [Tsukamurella sp. USMM236]|uniref:helix-turn-helix domain-containing protein n=1 Tax=Tsukamurella sp. USMM236 TaxID=3081301 RepID=UPI003017EF6A
MIFDDDEVSFLRFLVDLFVDDHHQRGFPVPKWMSALQSRLQSGATSVEEPADLAAPEYLSVTEVASELGISTRCARRRVARIGMKIGNQWVVSRDALPTRDAA